MDLKEVDVLGSGVGDHWYYASKASAVRRFLGGAGATRILDVGAGSGFFSKHLLERTQATEKCASALTGALVERFATFYAAYPKHRNRADAEKAFVKLNPDDSLLAVLLKAVEVAKSSRDDWRRENGKYIPYPASWLNGRMWEDEPDQTAYTPAEQSVIDAYNELMPADWARAITAPFSAPRAAAIREFAGFAPNKPDMPRRYFGHCATNLKADDRCGFDWLIKRETYLRVREGVVKHKEPA